MSWVHQYVPGIRFVVMAHTSRFLLIRNTSIHRDEMHISSQKWHERTKEEHCEIYMREQKVLDGLRLENECEIIKIPKIRQNGSPEKVHKFQI